MEILKAPKDKRPQEKMLHKPKKTDFLVETMEAGKQWNHNFKVLKENSETHTQQKSFNGNGGKLKTLSNKQLKQHASEENFPD